MGLFQNCVADYFDSLAKVFISHSVCVAYVYYKYKLEYRIQDFTKDIGID